MSRNEPCICGSGTKQKKCHPDIAPNSRAGEVLLLYSELEEQINQHYTQPNVQRPPCHEGCDSCCYHNFTITEIEFKIIAREIKTWTKEQIEKLFNETFRQLNLLKQDYPEVYSNLEASSTLNTSVLKKQYEIMSETYGIPCPMLDTQTGKCSVYNARPLICRTHGTTHSILTEYIVCNKIPSNLENAKITYNAVQIHDKASSWDKIEIGDQLFQGRQYPIIYWLKLFLEPYKLTGKVQIPNEGRDFNISADAAKRQQVARMLGLR
ncbi:YkgJ family cysteine cluster protein [Paenibacillus glycanilyticus]|uniref:Zinc/iron-chelating domain-containing protein n=1 Tax=Paenibacillus glycanilyticus TaxID=126569 RepID=A0ABQ6GPK3_9BACL|nr:YkgJ family cysteine cluster protein [Paenibacillus glycanilyticus]GLX71403.1 hypothetical protein MU1_57530 [Paenibacillus glycanilyticus]